MAKMKERLEQAMKEHRRVKILFDYPNSKSVKVKRGIIKKVRESSFDMIEDKDGLVSYSYRFIVEVKDEN
jgi:hypothetical protein